MQEKQGDKDWLSSVQLKWAALLLAMMAALMAYGCVQVVRAQHSALTQQAIEAGISLGSAIAAQAAIPVLGEDWTTLESLLQDAAIADRTDYVTISDHAGVVRVASDPALVGTKWNPEQEAQVIYSAQQLEVADRGDVLNFRLPIVFTDTVVGGVHLGLGTGQLEAALASSTRMLVGLGIATVLALAMLLYVWHMLLLRLRPPVAIAEPSPADASDPLPEGDGNG